MTLTWTDSHCHLDASEFAADRLAVLARARAAGVTQLVLPAVSVAQLDAPRELAQQHGLAYALGVHPLYVADQPAGAFDQLRATLKRWRDDPHLVAVGEIGLDHFVPGLNRELQERWYTRQLALAREFSLPVILHVRKSADSLLAHLRRSPVQGGIAHAFNGSLQQAEAFVKLGFKLGFGGALTFERALQLRQLATHLPLDALVLETDAPDIPPHWLYRTAEQRAHGETSRNEPAELPRIAATLAELRGVTLEALAEQLHRNTLAALPRLAALPPAATPAPTA
ncbi:MAG: TatD family hydrolase [Leptothrix sp. (in: b-proteobacteria)]